MICSFLVFPVLAKTSHDFIGLPRCKISNFSQDFQTIAHLFPYCEENSKFKKRIKTANYLIIREITDSQFFANVFAVL